MDRLHLALAPTLQRQHGVFSLAQADQAGLTRRQLERRRLEGLLVPCANGGHRVVSAPDSHEARLWAAHLSVPGSVISHRSAAWVLGLRDEAPRIGTSWHTSGVIDPSRAVFARTWAAWPVPTVTDPVSPLVLADAIDRSAAAGGAAAPIGPESSDRSTAGAS